MLFVRVYLKGIVNKVLEQFDGIPISCPFYLMSVGLSLFLCWKYDIFDSSVFSFFYFYIARFERSEYLTTPRFNLE